MNAETILYFAFALAMLAALIAVGTVFLCIYTASLLVILAGWQRRKTCLIWIGGIPLALLTLAWILFCLTFYY